MGKTALIHAAEHGSAEIMRLLLTVKDIDSDIADEVKLHDSALVLCFVAHLRKYRIVSQDSRTALIYATRRGNGEIAALLLLKHGINVNAIDAVRKYACARFLHQAAF
jgi:hypothetical protein